MVVGTKKRRYFKPSSSGIAAPVSGYVVKWLDNEESVSQVNSLGPYKKVEEAAEILQTYLKSGICSWMVRYDN
jgi:hypothetical protein